MTAWVLIVLMHYNRAIAMQDFTTKDKCEIAAKAIMATKIDTENGSAFCVEK